MSRIGNKLIKLEQGVTVTVSPENLVEVKGPKGTISRTFHKDMKIEVEGDEIRIIRPSNSIRHRELHGTTRALINNMVQGVSRGFSKSLEIHGVGYRAALRGNTLVVNVGYAKPAELDVPEGITVNVPTPTEIQISGIDRQAVGQFAAEVRNIRRPEPYLGKGIRYKGEVILHKEGKKAK